MTRNPRDLVEGILLLVAAMWLWVATMVWRAEMQEMPDPPCRIPESAIR